MQSPDSLCLPEPGNLFSKLPCRAARHVSEAFAGAASPPTWPWPPRRSAGARPRSSWRKPRTLSEAQMSSSTSRPADRPTGRCRRKHNSSAGGANANGHHLVEFGCLLDELDISMSVSSNFKPGHETCQCSVNAQRSWPLVAVDMRPLWYCVLCRTVVDCVGGLLSSMDPAVASMLYRS